MLVSAAGLSCCAICSSLVSSSGCCRAFSILNVRRASCAWPRRGPRYQDHGFFIGWENDGGLADAQAKTYKFVKEVGGKYYQRYMPWQIRSGLSTVYTKGEYYAKKAYKQVRARSFSVLALVAHAGA